MKLKTLADKLLIGLAYIPVIIQSTILIAGLGLWIYFEWESARTVLLVILGVILLLSLVFLICDLIYKRKEYLKFKRGEYPPLVIDINKLESNIVCYLPNPPSWEKRYEGAFMDGVTIPQQYITDLTVKGDMPIKCMEHILKMKNLSHLDLHGVKIMGYSENKILDDIFRNLGKLELLIPPPIEYWGIEKEQNQISY